MLSKKRWHQRSRVAKGLIWFMSFYLVLPAFTPWGWSAMAADAAAPAAAPAAAQPAAELPALPAAELVVGAMGGDEEIESFGSILAPVYSTGSGIFFVSPKMTFGKDDAREMNLGAGYRQLFGEYNVIAGVNAYYDKRWTVYDNQFEQYGVGVEVLTEWVDARANFYFADEDAKLADAYSTTTESSSTSLEGDDPYATGNTVYQHQEEVRHTTVTTHIFEMYEAARDGFDAEIGVKLPYVDQWTEVRVFGGYYKWDAAFKEDKSLDGLKARIEVRALPILYIDAAYVDDKELDGQQWTAGLRVNLPFDLANLAAGRNPFEGCLARTKPGQTPFAARITEQVIRDLKVRMVQSGFTENPDRQTTESHSHTVGSWEEPLMEDIMFVDQDRGADTNPGTYERPKLTIQNGADNAFGEMNVYVDSAKGSYNENVIVPDNVKLYGSGTRIEGIDGKYFGTDIHPVVQGNGIGPTFTMSSPLSIHGTTATIAGFDIRSTGGGAEGIYGTFPNPDGPVSLTIKDNIIDGALQGIFLYGQAENFTASLIDNTIENSIDSGAYVHVWGASGTFDMTVSGGSFNNNAGGGLLIDAADYDDIAITLSRIEANNNYYEGIGVYAFGDDVAISGSRITANDNHGLMGVGMLIRAGAANSASVSLTDVTANGNEGLFAGLGAAVLAYAEAGDATVTLNHVTANENSGGYFLGSGVFAIAETYGTGTATVRMSDIEAENNTLSFAFVLDGAISGIFANGNGGPFTPLANSTRPFYSYQAAVMAEAFSTEGSATVVLSDIQASHNAGMGGVYACADANGSIFSVVPVYSYGDASVSLANVEASDNTLFFGGFQIAADLAYAGFIPGGGSLSVVSAVARSDRGDSAIGMSGITANNNRFEGADPALQGLIPLVAQCSAINAYAASGEGSAGILLTDLEANNNEANGAILTVKGIEDVDSVFTGVRASALSGGGLAVLSLSDIEASGNDGSGVLVAGNSYLGAATMDLNGYTVTGDVAIDLRRITANDNGQYGVGVLSTMAAGFKGEQAGITPAGGDIAVTLSRIEAGNNGYDGVNVWVNGTDRALTMDMTGSTLTYNDGNGLYLYTAGSLADSSVSVSGSSLHHNTGYDLNNTDGSLPVNAQGNWWGQAGGPDAADIYGDVDVSSPLSAAP